MIRKVRLNRNGIPILDPPGSNGLRRRCHDALHAWRTVASKIVDSDDDVDVWSVDRECGHCGNTDRVEVVRARRRTARFKRWG